MNTMKFFWGLIIVLLGLVLVAINAGWISTGIWWSILMLWPVVLIVAGLRLLLHDKDKLFLWSALAIVLLSTAYVVAVNQGLWQLSFSERNNFLNLEPSNFSESLTDKYDASTVKKLNISVSTGAVELNLRALPVVSATNILYQVNTQQMRKLSVERNISDGVVTLNINEDGTGFPNFTGTRGFKRQLDISLPSSLLFDLTLSSGASKVNADFSLLKPENVKFRIGASSGEIILSDLVTKQTFDINAGASSLTFKVPASLAVKATLRGGLNNVNSESADMLKTGDTYTTRDFEKKTSQLILTGDMGVSSIKFLQK